MRRPVLTAVRWLKVECDTVVPVIINEDLDLALSLYGCSDGPPYDRLEIWSPGSETIPATRLFTRSANFDNGLIPIQNGTRILTLGRMGCTVWDSASGQEQLAAAIWESSGVPTNVMEQECLSVATNDKLGLAAACYNDQESIRLFHYNSPGLFKIVDAPAEWLTFDSDGQRLIAVDYTGIAVHSMLGNDMVNATPQFKVRAVTNRFTQDFSNGVDRLKIPNSVPRKRGQILSDHGNPSYLTMASDEFTTYLQFAVETVIQTGGQKQGLNLMGVETWAISKSKPHARMVRFDAFLPDDDTVLGRPRCLLGISMRQADKSVPHFLAVFEYGVIARPVSYERFQTQISKSDVTRFPTSIPGTGKLGHVTQASVSASGSHIVTAHSYGDVVVWEYSY